MCSAWDLISFSEDDSLKGFFYGASFCHWCVLGSILSSIWIDITHVLLPFITFTLCSYVMLSSCLGFCLTVCSVLSSIIRVCFVFHFFCLANIFPDFYPSSPWLCLSCQLYQGPLERTMVIILFNNCSLPLFPSIYQLYYSELYIAFLL